MPTIKNTLVKEFLEQAKKDGLEASIECYLKEWGSERNEWKVCFNAWN